MNPVDSFPFLVGEAVEQIWVWGPIRVVLDLEENVYVDVYRGSYTEPGEVTVSVDGVQAPRSAGPVLDLLGKRLTAASAADGTLTLRFDNGSELRAFPDAQFESWAVVCGPRVIQCLPGGDLGDW